MITRFKRLPKDVHVSYIGLHNTLSIIQETGEVRFHDGITPGGLPCDGIPPYPEDDAIYGLRNGSWVQIDVDIIDTGPGPQEVQVGNAQLGFFGEVTQEELFTPLEMTDITNLTEGALHTSTVTWLKFFYKNKILFVPLRPLRDSVSWNDLYQKGLVYGTSGPGDNPSGDPIDQHVLAVKEHWSFKVRLLKGANSNPAELEGESIPTNESEWDQLLYRVLAVHPNPEFTEDPWAEYTPTELGFGTDAGNQSWVQESMSNTEGERIVRGGELGAPTPLEGTINNSFVAWRPVLELIP